MMSVLGSNKKSSIPGGKCDFRRHTLSCGLIFKTFILIKNTLKFYSKFNITLIKNSALGQKSYKYLSLFVSLGKHISGKGM